MLLLADGGPEVDVGVVGAGAGAEPPPVAVPRLPELGGMPAAGPRAVELEVAAMLVVLLVAAEAALELEMMLLLLIALRAATPPPPPPLPVRPISEVLLKPALGSEEDGGE